MYLGHAMNFETWDAVTFEGPCSKRTKSHLKKPRPPSGTEMTETGVFGIDVKIFVEFDVGWQSPQSL
jgi:hypothetical protein